MNIITEPSRPIPLSPKEKNRVEQEALFERRWLQDPEQFNPARTSRTQVESDRLLTVLPITKDKRALDLGTGFGYVAEKLSQQGIKVDALDISQNCLKRLHLPDVTLIQDYFPHTKLADGAYDLIVAANLIAELPESERRLAVSEIARLLTRTGTAVVSTPIDIHSDDALVRFITLLETEFDIDRLIFSHHRLSIQLPYLQNSVGWLNFLENLASFFWQDQAISHVIALVHKRPIILASAPTEDRKPKKSVWE